MAATGATKTAAKKAATATQRAKAQVNVIEPAPTPTEPVMVDARAIAEVYHKAKKANDWCDDGVVKVAQELAKLGVPVVDESDLHLSINVQIDPDPEVMDGHYLSERVAAQVGKALNEALAAALGGDDRWIEVVVPYGNRGDMRSVRIRPKVVTIYQRAWPLNSLDGVTPATR